jgi:SagB-type dehydrogenase family enzyme
MLKNICGAVMVLWFTLAHLGAAGHGAETVKLPPPVTKGTVSVEEALQGRRSTRQFAARPLEVAQVSQLLWAADGINRPEGKRTAPAARAAYAIDLYLVAGERGVTGLAPGLYRYLAPEQALEVVAKGEFRAGVAKACNSQAWMATAPVLVAIAGDYARCAVKNGDKAPMYTHFEAGFVAQNLLLEAGALGLGAGIVGGFNDQVLAQALQLPKAAVPLMVLPVGYKN